MHAINKKINWTEQMSFQNEKSNNHYETVMELNELTDEELEEQELHLMDSDIEDDIFDDDGDLIIEDKEFDENIED